MPTRISTYAYAIAGTIVFAYLAFLALARLGVLERALLPNLYKFALLLVMSLIAGIGFYFDEMAS